MRLYRIELYKIVHRKIFIAGILAILGLMFAYFWFVEVGDERCMIDNQKYSGYEAIQMNKKITEEFTGTITDEKISRIIRKYGLPSKIDNNMSGWQDGNYLNDFVTRFFTNGSWEAGIKPTEKYALEDTDFGKAYKGLTPILEYTTGWKVFTELIQFGLMLGSIMIICGISGIFADESQTKMLSLIFTTSEGKRTDIIAKVFACFTTIILLYVGIVGISLGLCNAIYGLNGEKNLTGVVVFGSMWKKVDKVPFLNYLAVILVLGFLAFLSLGVLTLCVSAYQDSTFGAVVITALCWAFPLLIRIFFGGLIWILVDAMPMFLIMQVNLSDIYGIWYIIGAINFGISIVCLIKGMIHYKKK